MSKRRGDDEGLVYSTEHGRMCPSCGKAKTKCSCKKSGGKSSGKSSHKGGARPPTPVSGGGVRVARSTKGRKGKGVTVVTGLDLSEFELAQLGKKLKNLCGAGGTVRDGIIEVQGEHRDRIVDELNKLGHKAKKSGG